MRFLALLLLALLSVPAHADVRITRDFGGHVDQYKKRYAAIRDSGERVIIDGICNSACTLVLGIVPLNKICVTPRAAMGFHQAYYDKRYTAGLYVQSYAGTDELMSYYPDTLKGWIEQQGGLARQMKTIRNGVDLWAIIDPCPDEF
ncbi:MAG TPA: hypothetical protein VJL90_03395 [Pseudorhodoplanes sp.]|nr:hypothetical protein [Pseudorhodoplanes sp.]